VPVGEIELTYDRTPDDEDAERTLVVPAQQLGRPASLGDAVERAGQHLPGEVAIGIGHARDQLGVGVDERDDVAHRHVDCGG
jgi:hypothetical protein